LQAFAQLCLRTHMVPTETSDPSVTTCFADADSNKVAQSAAELGNMVLGQSDGAPALQRSAAEILAAAAAIGDSAFAQALLRRVVEAMAGTANPVRCS
jgi:hypothetical protein